MNMMLDLKNMTDEEFSILVTPSAGRHVCKNRGNRECTAQQ